MSEYKEFTKKAEDVFWSEVNRSEDEKIFKEKIENNEDIVQYLNEKKLTMTPGYGLKRYICENLAVGFNDEKGSYIIEIKSNGNLKQYEVDNFDNETGNLEKYIEIVLEASKNEGLDTLRKGHILGWFRDGFKRKTLIKKIAFILEMKVENVDAMLNKFLGEMGYNFREVEEVISFFCLKNSLGSESIDRILKIYKENDCIEDGQEKTIKIKNDIKEITLERDFIEYLLKKKKSFIKTSRIIKKEFIKLYEDVFYIVELLEGEKINRDIIEERMLEGVPKLNNNSGGYKSILKNEKINSFMGNILNRDKVDKIYKDARIPTRKDIIMIYFFRFSLLVNGYEELIVDEKFGEETLVMSKEHRENSNKSMEIFRYELDILLSDLGMGSLYIPNRFDNLILLSACTERPYEFFSDFIESTFEGE